MTAVLDTAKQWAHRIKRDVITVYYAARDPDTPWEIRALAIMVAAYALSPIDLIPDFIPILGYLDDLLIVPLGLWVVIRLLPPHVLTAARAKAELMLDRPQSKAAAVVIVCIWLLLAGIFGYWLWPR